MKEQNEQKLTTQSEKNNSPLKIFIIYALIIIAILWAAFGILTASFVLYIFIAGADSSSSSLYILYMIAGIIVAVALFLIIRLLKKFRQKYRLKNNGNIYFYILLILAISYPFFYYFFQSDIWTGRFIKQQGVNEGIYGNLDWEEVSKCENNEFGSLITLNNVNEYHEEGQRYLGLTLDITVAKNLEVVMHGDGLATQNIVGDYDSKYPVLYFRLKENTNHGFDINPLEEVGDIPNYRYIIPKGQRKLEIIFDTVIGDRRDTPPIFKYKINGPYKLNLDFELRSEETDCRYKILKSLGAKESRYVDNPTISILEDYITESYNWFDFDNK